MRAMTPLKVCSKLLFLGATFSDLTSSITAKLTTGIVKALFDKDTSLLVGLDNFLQLLNSEQLDGTFLPYLMFIDAAQKQYAKTKSPPQTPPTPHTSVSLFMGKSFLLGLFLLNP